MNIKNYTSGVPASRTLEHIESVLVSAGAAGIARQYDTNKRLTAVHFHIEMPGNKRALTIKLPANVERVYDVLKARVKKPHKGTLERLQEQAERTAWKLMEDWVRVQVSLIHMGQADMQEVFLPYILCNGTTTFYEQLKQNNFKQLPERT